MFYSQKSDFKLSILLCLSPVLLQKKKREINLICNVALVIAEDRQVIDAQAKRQYYTRLKTRCIKNFFFEFYIHQGSLVIPQILYSFKNIAIH